MKDKPIDEGSAGALVPISKIQQATAGQYLQQVKGLVAKKKQKEAFSLMQQAHVTYPGDPYLLSYYGWLQAVVDRRYRSGVVALLRKHAVKGREVQFGSVYANLVRAYIAAGRKKDAVEALQKGLKYESRNSELLREQETMGRRKKAAVPFLDRSNPVNKYLGLIRGKLT